MKASVIGRAAYIQAHGEPSRSGGSLDPHVASLMGKLQKLQMSNGNGSGEYILIEPDKDEELKTVRSRVYGAIRASVRRMRPATFAVRMLTRRDEHHILVWKQPIVADAPVVVERAEQTTEKPAVVHPAARPRASVPHLAHAAAR
jgi:hypothetical protein